MGLVCSEPITDTGPSFVFVNNIRIRGYLWWPVTRRSPCLPFFVTGQSK